MDLRNRLMEAYNKLVESRRFTPIELNDASLVLEASLHELHRDPTDPKGIVSDNIKKMEAALK